MDSRLEVGRANETFLELLTAAAQSDAQPPFELAQHLASKLLGLSPAARLQLAQRPYALLTFRLHDAAWWKSIEDGRAQSVGAWLSPVCRERAVALARRFLTLTWSAMTRGSLKSSVILGISPAVTEILSRLTLEQLERIAEVHTLALGPRWPDCLKIWHRLLDAATGGEPHNLDLVDRWAAQVSATQMMRNG